MKHQKQTLDAIVDINYYLTMLRKPRHEGIEFKQLYGIHKMCRDDIIERNNLTRGEFHSLYNAVRNGVTVIKTDIRQIPFIRYDKERLVNDRI